MRRAPAVQVIRSGQPAANRRTSTPMQPNSWVLEPLAAESWQAPTKPAGSCYIGLPADKGAIDTAWLGSVLRTLLDRHERVMVLLASELLAYGAQSHRVGTAPSRKAASRRDLVSADTMARWLEVEDVKHGLASAEYSRMLIASWAHFTDAKFAEIWRELLSALARERRFRRDVLTAGRAGRPEPGRLDGSASDVSRALSRLECLAMRLRICEVAGYQHEYGSGEEDPLAKRLYDGAYAAEGLTVEALVGHPPRRFYESL